MPRTLKATTLVAAMILFGCFAAAENVYAQETPPGRQLQVNYAENTADSYTLFVDSGRYSISQSYSWVRDEGSRYSLASYSIDGGPYVEIQRKARGNFMLDVAMDSGHTVVFQAVVQYPVSAVADHGTLEIIFSPPSPTGDEWFDVGSDIIVTVSNEASPSSSDTRQRIASWSLDNSKRSVGSEVEPSFTAPIKVSSAHQVKFESQTQYYVRVVTDHGTESGEGWYDEGSTATISVDNKDPFSINVFDGWDDESGMPLKETETLLVDSPKTLTAKWRPDYGRLAGIAIAPIGGAIAVVLLKKRSSDTGKRTSAKESPAPINKFQLSASAPLLAIQQTAKEAQESKSHSSTDDSNYSREITGYALQKSLEKLQSLRTSGLASDAKYSKVNEKLEQSFD
ncbi:MAG TPA: hypothetical protein VIB07_05155 [Nitrososphaera sp.]